ncbi:hypothetical protein [Erwinia oleae]|uniref:hypothetical protein n=1 Tax=Erwinia oleae TaxID=796334 RepID=UPI0013629478|nr:hypothetical protein [Erwinia oleae]
MRLLPFAAGCSAALFGPDKNDFSSSKLKSSPDEAELMNELETGVFMFFSCKQEANEGEKRAFAENEWLLYQPGSRSRTQTGFLTQEKGNP